MKNRKLQFVDNLFDIIPTNTENETAKKILVDFLLANTNNGKLYKYREVNEYALDNLRHNTLFCAKPSTFNDPFDCRIGVDFSSYIEYKFSPKINKMMDLFEKYMMLKSRRSTNESCSVEEKIIFDTWEKVRN